MGAYIMIAGVLSFCATFTLTALDMLHEDIGALHELYGATAWGNSPWDHKSPLHRLASCPHGVCRLTVHCRLNSLRAAFIADAAETVDFRDQHGLVTFFGRRLQE